jgi:hypothetical protein
MSDVDIQAFLNDSFKNMGSVDASGRSEFLPQGLHLCKLVALDFKHPKKTPTATAIIPTFEIVESNNAACAPGSRWVIWTSNGTLPAIESQKATLKQIACASVGKSPRDPALNSTDEEKSRKITALINKRIGELARDPSACTFLFRIDSTESTSREGKVFTNHSISEAVEGWHPGEPREYASAPVVAPTPAADSSALAESDFGSDWG